MRGYLADLAEDPAFGEATGNSVSNERMADREMVLRFLAFRLTDPAKHAQRDFDQFLIDAMHRVNRLTVGSGPWWRWSSVRRCVARRTSSVNTPFGNGGAEGTSRPSTKRFSRRSR
ncbi:hypothetical protein NKH18_38445 [Streptomyces sp. M10(2022)]